MGSKFKPIRFNTFAGIKRFKTIITDKLDAERMKQFAQLKNITLIETTKGSITKSYTSSFIYNHIHEYLYIKMIKKNGSAC